MSARVIIDAFAAPLLLMVQRRHYFASTYCRQLRQPPLFAFFSGCCFAPAAAAFDA